MRNLLFTWCLIGSFILSAQQENARIEYSKLTINIENPNDLDVISESSTIIYNEKGYRNAVFVNYEDQFRELVSIQVTIKDMSGKKIKSLGMSQVNTFALSQSFETGDGNYIVLDPEYKNFPFKVEIKTFFDHDGFLNLPTWVPQSNFNTSVDLSTLEVITQKEYDIRYMGENIGEPRINEAEELNLKRKKSYTWSVSDLGAVDNNVDYKSFYKSQPKVYLAPDKFILDGNEGSMGSWTEFGDWFLKLNQDRDQLLSKTETFLNSLPPDLPVKSMVDTIYSYMQDRTRYVSIQLGIGGFQSLPADFVDEKGYGECKALTNYMKAMLRYKGVESNYILVKAGNDVPDVNDNFPSNQFNHVFLGVPTASDTILLECTSQSIPSGYIGSFTDDRNVLWIDEGKSKMIKTPVYSERENVYQKQANIKLDSEGNASLNVSVNHSGVFFDQLQRYQYFTESQVEQYNYSQFDYSDFTIKEFNVNENSNEATFTTNYDLQINNLAKKVGDKIVVPNNMLQAIDHYVDPNEITKYMEVRRGFTTDETVVVDLPENYWLTFAPQDVKIAEQYGSYEYTATQKGNQIVINRKLILKKGVYEGDEFERFLEFKDKIEKLDRKKMVLSSKT
ncbi:DUF3858 domain-containing protein [Ekhidna sp. To15]|uniref:DUF3858 domain-containing protein n=1 Tax=Ekhidna sp. To15 TaxID=3395267 RepID=UPI003F51FB94